MNVDREEMSRIAFDTITLTFTDDQTGLTPQLKIEKPSEGRSAFAFYFRHNSRHPYKSFTERPSSESFFTYNIHRGTQEVQAAARRQSQMTQEFRSTFLSNIKLSWLPLLRARISGPAQYEESEYENGGYANPIDEKIFDLTANITRYFSRLDARAAAETKDFQRDYFLSLLNYSPENIFSIGPDQDAAHYANLEKVMRDIFVELGIAEKDFGKQLKSHFARVRQSRQNLTGETIKIEDYFAVADTRRLLKIVANFREYEEKKRRIFEPKQKFIELMNGMLINKVFDFTSSNESRIRTKTKDSPVEMYDLSSGEKQLFVILAEALLQEGRPYIFIADEPELSLHVEWQESIVRNIKILNEKCQIIFATHSPDVVSSYQKNITDFGKI